MPDIVETCYGFQHFLTFCGTNLSNRQIRNNLKSQGTQYGGKYVRRRENVVPHLMRKNWVGLPVNRNVSDVTKQDIYSQDLRVIWAFYEN